MSHIHKIKKIKVVGKNPMRSIRKAYRAKEMVPKRGRSQVRSGQKGAFPLPFFHWEAIKAMERAMRIRARPKGRNPGPGRLREPMANCVELQAVTTPMMKRIYPVIRSHFSMVLTPFRASFEVRS